MSKQETQAILALVQGYDGKDWASRRRGWSSQAEEPGKSSAEDFIHRPARLFLGHDRHAQ